MTPRKPAEQLAADRSFLRALQYHRRKPSTSPALAEQLDRCIQRCKDRIAALAPPKNARQVKEWIRRHAA